MTPERTLVDRVTRFLGEPERTPLAEAIAAFAAEYAREQVRLREDYWTGQIQTFCDLANRSEAKLTAARQREEEAKGEIVRLARTIEDVRSRAHLAESFAEAQAKNFRAENDRLTLAASESARTLQVEIEKLYQANEEAQTQRVRESHANTDLARANRALQAQVTALREALTEWHHQRYDLAGPEETRPWILRLGEAEDALAKLLGLPTPEAPKYRPQKFPGAPTLPQDGAQRVCFEHPLGCPQGCQQMQTGNVIGPQDGA